MTGIAEILRLLDRLIDGEADDLNTHAQAILATKLGLAARRVANPPPKVPENIIHFPRNPQEFEGGTSPRRFR